MYLTMFREPSQGGATLSKLFCGEQFLCDILEDEVREIEGQPVSDWKIKGATAIPHGVYEVTVENSQRFGVATLTVNDVPGFQYIRIHGGNTSADTEGCLLPGSRNSAATVASSRAALSYIRSIILPALDKGERVQIEIIPSTGVQA
jgi:hypothetical protein